MPSVSRVSAEQQGPSGLWRTALGLDQMDWVEGVFLGEKKKSLEEEREEEEKR